MSNNSLSGTLPAGLGNASMLMNLHLDNNRLTGTLPAEWVMLSTLKTLSLSNNKFTVSVALLCASDTGQPLTANATFVL